MGIHTINPWGSYPLNESPPHWLLSEMPRVQARRSFEQTMALREQRINVLTDLLAGFGIKVSENYGGVQRMNDWFVESVRPLQERNLPDGRTLSLCEDIALLLGDLLISRHPRLRWEFFIWGRKNIAYQSHVIMGFPEWRPNSRDNLDLPGIVYGYAAHVLSERLDVTELLDVPEGHPLSGILAPRVPVDGKKFMRILEHVDERLSVAQEES